MWRLALAGVALSSLLALGWYVSALRADNAALRAAVAAAEREVAARDRIIAQKTEAAAVLTARLQREAADAAWARTARDALNGVPDVDLPEEFKAYFKRVLEGPR